MKRYPGVVTGTVKSLDDPQGQGRIEVHFPWLSETQRSAWAPVAVPLAGKDRGQFFMPEIDDEVLVAFEHGDFDHPFIIGFLWNGVDTPPETTNKNRVIKTPGGHTIRFEDTDGAKKVIIRSNAGHTVLLDDNQHEVKVSGEGGSNEITIQTTTGVVTVKATTQVSVQAPQIEFTQGAVHPLVFGDQLLTYLNQLVALFNAHLHVGQLAAGILPVTPMTPVAPFPPATPALISTQVRTG